MRKIALLVVLVMVLCGLSACSSNTKGAESREVEEGQEVEDGQAVEEGFVAGAYTYDIFKDGTAAITHYDDGTGSKSAHLQSLKKVVTC